ncbi:MAG: hypothetical protein V2A54_07310 [Bacteroidota bacterium]
MSISAFSMVKNADKLYYPVKETILSVLPIVDEFIIALGNCDADDKTREQILSIQSPKVKIFDRVWSEKDFVDGRVFAKETTFALNQCSGDWCIYLQADEVIHEKDHEEIVKMCNEHQNNPEVDGFLFKYYHFWGDFDHYLPFHGWYKNEIRIVRNHKNIFSWKDAQSFRKDKDEKLNVLPLNARIYHYGWVRPPERMQTKRKEQHSMHHGKAVADADTGLRPGDFDYGPLGKIPSFKGTHPSVMDDFRKKLNWQNQLNFTKHGKISRRKHKHEKWKYRLLSCIENKLNGGKDFFGYKNWNLLK